MLGKEEKYILDENRNPVQEPDLLKWGQFMQTGTRKVAKEIIGDSKVSTVFLGLDHGWHDPAPVLWETMVFGGKLDQEQDRCGGTWDDALKMHDKMVKRVKGTE